MKTISFHLLNPSFIINLIERDDGKKKQILEKAPSGRLFKARMILRAAFQDCMWDAEGNLIERPHWFELAKQKWNHIYKTTGTPCSCWMCKGESYNRRDFKKETRRIIKESFE